MQCHEKLMYLEMAVIQKEIYQNPAATSLHYSKRHVRFLGIMMPELLYVQDFNKPFIPTNASDQQGSELLICQKAAKQVYDTYKAVTQCPHNQFQRVIHEDYFAKLDDPDVGFAKSTPASSINVSLIKMPKLI